MSGPLGDSRRRLRGYLLPNSPAAEGEEPHLGGDHFPRSKLMKFAVDPRNRQVIALAGSVLAVLATRAAGPARMGLFTDIARSFSRFKKG